MIENKKEDIVYNTYLYMIIADGNIKNIGEYEIIFFDINSDDVFKIRQLCRKYMIYDEYARLNANGRTYPIDIFMKVLGGLNGKC